MNIQPGDCFSWHKNQEWIETQMDSKGGKMITGKELHEIALATAKRTSIFSEGKEMGSYKEYDWQAIANELNQRTCETCGLQSMCKQEITITKQGIALQSGFYDYDKKHNIDYCSLYTKEG